MVLWYLSVLPSRASISLAPFLASTGWATVSLFSHWWFLAGLTPLSGEFLVTDVTRNPGVKLCDRIKPVRQTEAGSGHPVVQHLLEQFNLFS